MLPPERDAIEGGAIRMAQVNDRSICFVKAGSGPPVVLLHGFPQTHAMWRDVVAHLSPRFTVIAPDLRGYGARSKPPGTQACIFRHMAQDQLALMADPGVFGLSRRRA